MNYTTNAVQPTVNVTINKSRLKVYTKDNTPTVYLKDGQEFEIELFNPTQKTICARISINNKRISQAGLILRPGERVFLERYIDIAQRFKFETYIVSNTAEVQAAIANNGDLKVEFFNEKEIPPYVVINSGSYWNNNPSIFTINSTGGYSGGSLTNGPTYGTLTSTGPIVNASYTSSTDNLEDYFIPVRGNDHLKSKRSLSKKIETGRVEVGSHSNQKLHTVNKEFETWAFYTINYKLLPVSQQMITSSEIRSYCHNCGKKQERTNKFCPHCGTQLK